MSRQHLFQVFGLSFEDLRVRHHGTSHSPRDDLLSLVQIGESGQWQTPVGDLASVRDSKAKYVRR